MGYSTPKPRFDLAEFLKQKANPKLRRRTKYFRATPPETPAAEAPVVSPPLLAP